MTIADFNGSVRSAFVATGSVTLAYSSVSRAIATLGSPASSIDVDGAPFWKAEGQHSQSSFLFPSGQHVLTFTR